MSNEVLKNWILHFQMRIILQEYPNPIFDIYLDFLNRVYCGIVCDSNVDKICKVIHYLYYGLPEECLPKQNPVTNPATLDCKFYKLRVIISISAGLGGTTIEKDENIFEYSNGNFVLDYKKAILNVIGIPSPQATYLYQVDIKYTIDSEWVNLIPQQQIQLI